MDIFSFFKKYRKNIFTITIIGFIAGIFLGFGGYIRATSNIDTVATINGKKISLTKFNRIVNQNIDNYRDQGHETNEEVVRSIKQQVFRELLQEEVFWQESKKFGIVVTDAEVYQTIMRIPAFQKDGRFDRETYIKTLLYRLKMTPKEFEESRKKQVAMYKLRELVISSIKVSPKELMLAYGNKYGNLKNFEKDKQSFAQEFLQEKQVAVLEEWYKQINNNLKVKMFVKDL